MLKIKKKINFYVYLRLFKQDNKKQKLAVLN